MHSKNFIALKFAYDGTHFFGSQRQPNKPTIEGTIITAMRELGIIESALSNAFRCASRTDRGVSALGNVLSFHTDFNKNKLIDALNTNLEHIWFYGLAEVDELFNPRYAYERWYRYYLPISLLSTVELERLHEISALFVGEHDFSFFSRPEGRSPIRTIKSIKLRKNRHFIVFDFRAESFLWGQVRRIVGAIHGCVNNDITVSELARALSGEYVKNLKKLHPAKPEFLVLMDVKYKGIKFEYQTFNHKIISRLKNAMCLNIMRAEFFRFLLQNRNFFD